MAGTDTSQISPYTASCGGGLVLNKDVYNMQPGEALQLSNFEPSVKGGYRRLNGTTKYNSTIVPQVAASSERVLLSAIFNDIIIAGRGGTVIAELHLDPGHQELQVKEVPILMILINSIMMEQIKL